MTATDVGLLGSRQALLGYIKSKVADADAAEDILQDSLAKALRSAPALRDDQRLVPWFYRIMNNAIIDHYRRRSVERKRFVSDEVDVGGSIEPEEVQALCNCVRDVVRSLKPEYAEVLEELELNERDPEEVAVSLGITRNNLKVRRHRARMQLRDRLEEICGACSKEDCLDCSC